QKTRRTACYMVFRKLLKTYCLRQALLLPAVVLFLPTTSPKRMPSSLHGYASRVQFLLEKPMFLNLGWAVIPTTLYMASPAMPFSRNYQRQEVVAEPPSPSLPTCCQ